MMPRNTIAQIAKVIGQELGSGAGPSEGALAAGPMLAEAGATTELVGRLLAEARRKRPNDRMIDAYAFMLDAALGTLRVQANGGNVGADQAIAEGAPGARLFPCDGRYRTRGAHAGGARFCAGRG